MEQRRFGTCCENLMEATTQLHEQAVRMFRVLDDGTFFLTVAIGPNEGRTAFYDMAVLFCPFCGIGLQTRDELRRLGHLPAEEAPW